MISSSYSKINSLSQVIVLTNTATKSKVSLAIDVVTTQVSLGGAPRFALMSPSKGPLRAGGVGPASPGERKDTGEPLAWALHGLHLALRP